MMEPATLLDTSILIAQGNEDSSMMVELVSVPAASLSRMECSGPNALAGT